MTICHNGDVIQKGRESVRSDEIHDGFQKLARYTVAAKRIKKKN